MRRPQDSGWQRRLAAQALKSVDHLERVLNPLRAQLQRDPYYRFRSLKEVQAAVRLGVRIDVNHATVDDWLRLPGLSIHQASALTALTNRGGALMSIEDVAAALSVPTQRLLPLAPILDFRYYDEHLALTQALDVNQASGPQLMQIPGMSTALVQQLLYHRRFGAYRSWADLQHRLRLPPAQISHLIHYLRM